MDLEQLRNDAAYQRLKELTPYMSEKDRQRLVDEGRSETYRSVQIGWDKALEAVAREGVIEHPFSQAP